MKTILIILAFISSFFLSCQNKQKDINQNTKIFKEFISEIDSSKYFNLMSESGINGMRISENRRYLLNICQYTRFKNKDDWRFIKEYDDYLHKQSSDLLNQSGIYLSTMYDYYTNKGIKVDWDSLLSKVIYYEIIDLDRMYKNRMVGKLYYQKELSIKSDKHYYQSDTVNNFTFRFWHDSEEKSFLRAKEGGAYLLNQVEKCVPSYLDNTGFYGKYICDFRNVITQPVSNYRLILDEEVEQNKIINKSFFYK